MDSSYWWSILVWPFELFSDFSFDDVTADWAEDLISSLLCWLQMAWCWFYTTLLDFFYEVVEITLPELPNYGIDLNAFVPLFAAADRWFPLTELLGLSILWVTVYLPVRIVFTMIPFFNS